MPGLPMRSPPDAESIIETEQLGNAACSSANCLRFAGGPILPTMPSDAVFKALAVVPMTNGGREGIPIDAKELIRLIKQESEG
jgi:hypothetical protein